VQKIAVVAEIPVVAPATNISGCARQDPAAGATAPDDRLTRLTVYEMT
jgi:type IV pilus biogenesis protein CpaD/CtpE